VLAEALLGGLAGDAEDRRYGAPWVAGLAGAGDGVAQCRRRLLAGSRAAATSSSACGSGSRAGGVPLPVVERRWSQRAHKAIWPYRMVARTWQSGRSAA